MTTEKPKRVRKAKNETPAEVTTKEMAETFAPPAPEVKEAEVDPDKAELAQWARDVVAGRRSDVQAERAVSIAGRYLYAAEVNALEAAYVHCLMWNQVGNVLMMGSDKAKSFTINVLEKCAGMA